MGRWRYWGGAWVVGGGGYWGGGLLGRRLGGWGPSFGVSFVAPVPVYRTVYVAQPILCDLLLAYTLPRARHAWPGSAIIRVRLTAPSDR